MLNLLHHNVEKETSSISTQSTDEDPLATNTNTADNELLSVEDMDIKAIKTQLKERNLSIKGTHKVLAKRLLERLQKEKDPDYVPFKKGRHCKWCEAPMKKRRNIFKKTEFYGCSAYPTCQYTTSMSGHARPDREHLKGVAATTGGRDSRFYEWNS